MPEPESVVVVGGSIAGLASALALAGGRYHVTIVERDPEPPAIDPLSAFDAWERPGVPQYRHAHILLARLHTVIRDHHPALLQELLQAGLTLSEVDQMLPPTHVGKGPPEPDDDSLRHLWGRRATFEYVLRRHVGTLPHVHFVHGARVEGLAIERRGDALRVTGVEVLRDGAREVLHGDVIVDASGGRTKAGEWLGAHGARIQIERHESPYAYSCRHYKLRDPSAEPPRRGTGANLDYLWYGLFCAEHGNFSIALACPNDEGELAEALRRPEGFDRICAQMPLLSAWLAGADAVTKVHGAGGLANRWTTYGARGGTRVLGYFAVGDSQLQTNPMYGRGCSQAFVQAQALAEALATHADDASRGARYYARCRALLRSHFDAAVAADRLYGGRARALRGERVALPDRVLSFLYDRAFMPALLSSLFVAREMLKAMEMREVSPVWRRLVVAAHVARAFVLGPFRQARAELPALGPPRTELLRALPAHFARATAYMNSGISTENGRSGSASSADSSG